MAEVLVLIQNASLSYINRKLKWYYKLKVTAIYIYIKSELFWPICFNFQRLLCINPPLFEIYQVLLSPTQHHVALIGIKGLQILELPKKMGKEFWIWRWKINSEL